MIPVRKAPVVLLRLGICAICIPLGAVVVVEACNAIASHSLANVADIQIDGSASVALGGANRIVSSIAG